MRYLQLALLCVLICAGLLPFSADAMELTIRIGRSAAAYASGGIPVYVKDAPRVRYSASDCNGQSSRMRATNCDGSTTYNSVRLRASDCSGSNLIEFQAPAGEVRDVRERRGSTKIYYRGGSSVEVRERWDLIRGRHVVVDYDD